MSAAAKVNALRAFVAVIDSTGGVEEDDKGYPVPVADTEWIDLGAAYVVACEALGVQPKGLGSGDAAAPLPGAEKIRQLAQESYGAASDHEDVQVQDDPPEQVEGGYWVRAKLWVPMAWTEE